MANLVINFELNIAHIQVSEQYKEMVNNFRDFLKELEAILIETINFEMAGYIADAMYSILDNDKALPNNISYLF